MDTPTPNRRRRLSIGAGVVLVLLALAIAVLVTALGPRGSSQTLVPDEPAPARAEPTTGSDDSIESDQNAPDVFVHIIGAVNNPGLYQLHDGDRAVDAVAAAGGLAADADQAQLNLARFISDGEQIVVPRVGEAPPVSPGGAAGAVGQAGTVNINSADASALEELPGVGPALAVRIVEWREANGPFAAVDDLLNVTGIGQKKLDGMRESIAL